MARTEYGTTWWGEKWLDALTGIDEENRIPRGKSYANTGKVSSFKVNEKTGEITARVAGHYDPFYRVKISMPAITKRQLASLMDKISSSQLVLSKLSARELDPEIMTLAEECGIKLFPETWEDLHMECSCPDYAVPCKHLAAVIYRLSQEIDANPFIIFTLHGIDLIAELDRRGISIERAAKAELPSWSELMGSGVLAEEGHEVPGDWLKQLSDLTFRNVEFDASAFTALLNEQPAGYIRGDLRALMESVLKSAAKLAKSQLTNISEHSAPCLSQETHDSFLTVNSWGQAVPGDALTWEEFDPLTGKRAKCAVDAVRKNGSVCRLHEMFSGYLNSHRLSQSPEEVEALYYIWVIATKLTMASAVMPRIYEPESGIFNVCWIPAVTNEAVGEIVEQVGRLIYKLDKPYLEILRKPENISPLALGQVVLGIFVTSYVATAFKTSQKRIMNPPLEETVLFAETFGDEDDDPAATEVKLRLAEWLSPLELPSGKLQPILTVRDLTEEFEKEGKAKEAEQAAYTPLSLAFGFALKHRGDTGLDDKYVGMSTVFEDDRYQAVRFEAMRCAARLTKYCPKLNDLLREQGPDTTLTMQMVAPLMFESLPALRLLGVQVILPRSLRNLLRPETKFAVDLKEKPAEGSGFLNLMELLDFDWEIAAGDTKISRAEFAALCNKAGQVVRFHDSFMYVDEKAIARIKKRLEGQSGQMTPMQAMRAALSGSLDHYGVVLSHRLKETIENLLKDDDISLPKDLHATLRPYQERGYRWMMRNFRIGLGSILADDMGLGKTLQVITVLEELRERGTLAKEPALVVVPTTLITNWMREIARFAPKLKAHLYYGTYRNLKYGKAHLILTTYGTMRSKTSLDALKKLSFSVLVLDEAQAIKNHATSTARSVRQLKRRNCIAMSGTPVENRLEEYWSIMEAANPGLLGSVTSFRSEYAKPIELDHDQEAASHFLKLTAPFIMRRLKTDKSVIGDLPEKISSDEYCILTKEQAALYKARVSRDLKRIQTENSQFARQAMVIQLILQLKQICNSPVQYEEKSSFNKPEDSGKMQRLFEILDSMQESGRKTLIFTQFKTMGNLLQKWIGERYGRQPQFLHGGVSVAEPQKMVDRFQNDRAETVMVLSIKAAGTGLNLTAASAVVHYDLWWNPAVESQATDRAFRIGQKQNVNVYRLICANSFEEKINEMIESKKALAELTVASGENWIGDLTNDEMTEIFSLTED